MPGFPGAFRAGAHAAPNPANTVPPAVSEAVLIQSRLFICWRIGLRAPATRARRRVPVLVSLLYALVENRGLGLDGVALHRHLARLLADADAGLLPTAAAVLDDVAADDGVACRAVHEESPAFVVPDDVILERDPVRRHRLGFLTPIDAAKLVADDGVLADEVVAVFVADGHAVTAVVLQPVALGYAAAHAPTKEESVVAIRNCARVFHRGPLRSAAGMQPKPGATLDDTAIHLHVVRLLETDAVAIVVAHEAVADHAMVATIEEDAGGAAAVHLGRVLRAIAVHRQVLHAGLLQVVTADHRINCGCEPAVPYKNVRVQGTAEREVVAAAVQDGRADSKEVPHRF